MASPEPGSLSNIKERERKKKERDTAMNQCVYNLWGDSRLSSAELHHILLYLQLIRICTHAFVQSKQVLSIFLPALMAL